MAEEMKETTEQIKERHDMEIKESSERRTSEIEEMRERHGREIEELREKCNHKKVSDWMESQWAPGHGGPRVKVCNNCGLVMDTEKWNLNVEVGVE